MKSLKLICSMKNNKEQKVDLTTKEIATEEVRFIDGTFNAADAEEILLSVLRDKINFHACLLHSNMERFGVDASNSELRISELREEKERVKEIINRAKEAGALVNIDSPIRLKLVK